MKKSNILIAVFAIVAGASMAKAQDVKVSFDGRSADSVSFSALLEASVPGQNDKISPPEPVFEQQDAKTAALRTIMVSMNRGEDKTTETLLCRQEGKKLNVQGCKKQSDGSILTRQDVMDMVLQGFFPSEDFGAFPMSANRHSYCNQSGPEFFYCWDVTKYKKVPDGSVTKYITECKGSIAASYSGFPTISGGINCTYRTEEEQRYKDVPYETHECRKVDNC